VCRTRTPAATLALISLAVATGCGAGRPDPVTSELARPYTPAAAESAEAAELNVLESACERGDGQACHEAATLWREAFGDRSLESEPAIQRLNERAVAILGPLCDQGDGLACAAAGGILGDPANRGRDPAAAEALHEKARTLLPQRCESGDIDACGALIAIYGDGLGGPTDPRRSNQVYLAALALSAAACERGDPEPCYRHNAWWYSWMAIPDEEAALSHLASARKLFRAGCDQGSARACERLAQTFAWADLRDGSEDPWKARLAFQQACQLGHAGACVEAGRLWDVAVRKRRDRSKAREYLQRGCDRGNAGGCLEAADLCLKADPAVTRAFLGRACDLGSAIGCRRLADMLELGHGGPSDPAGARAAIARVRDHLTPGCEFGTGLHAAESCVRLGELLAGGAGALGDQAGARAAYGKALAIYVAECEAGDGFSCLVAADLSRAGATGEPSDAEADRLLTLACQTDLVEDICEDGRPRDDLNVRIEFAETGISISY